jgi:hypothetical protein
MARTYGLNSPSIYQLPGAEVFYGTPNYLMVTADMTSATWNTVASHEVFTCTGAAKVYTWVICTDTLTDAADAATIQYGNETATDAIIATTNAAGAGGDTISTGEIWADATPTETYGDPDSLILQHMVIGGLDIGYEIAGEALTGGSLDFHCVWYPMDSTGNVVVGAGGAL